MHIYFSGIGGAGIGPLALIAHQAGYEVSGSDKRDSSYIEYLRSKGITNINIGQTKENILSVHEKLPIDWYVYSSAVVMENADAPELVFCKEQSIPTSKRDELLNKIISDKNLKLFAVAGTHGKTTTTAMAIWLFKQLNIPVSYSVGAKISFGEIGVYDDNSEYFIYEADEFDRNFLAFKPYISIVPGIDYDHQEIFPTLDDYQAAFREFLGQTDYKVLWQGDIDRARLKVDEHTLVMDSSKEIPEQLTLAGLCNRLNAWQVVEAVHMLTHIEKDILFQHINRFPGLSRRFEKLQDNLYSDYAHTIEKIRGCLQTASELSKNVVVVYEPHSNHRQHFIHEQYKDLFVGVKKVYWVRTYLAREDPDQPLLTPEILIAPLEGTDAVVAELDDDLYINIRNHQGAGDLVVCITAGGGESLDEWIRLKIKDPK